MKNAWKSWGAGATLILLVTVVSYLPAWRGGFIFDDTMLITDNRIVKASDGLYRFWFTKEAPYYYPLTWSLWWFEWHLWGDSATGYHVVNVLLHAVDAILAWLVLRRLRIPGACLAALVFAVHPVNVATVAWISEQKNTLSMLFYALAILLYLRFDEEGRWRWYGLSLAAFALALLSKTAVVMLPVVLLGCVWWVRARLRWRDFLRCGPFFALSLLSGLVTVWFEYRALGAASAQTAGFPSRLAVAGWAPWFYLSKALLPTDLTVIYPKWEIDPSHWVSYVPGMILIGWLVVFWWKRETWGRPLLFGLGYFVVMLLPVLGFFDQGFFQQSSVADHWQYYSVVGVIALVVATGVRIGRGMGEQGRYWGTLAGVLVTLLLGAATWSRSCLYADAEALWQDNVTRNPQAWGAYNGLGTAMMERGRVQEAVAAYQQAVRIEPGYPRAHYNLGNALVRMGRLGDAMAHWEEAARLKPDFVEAHYNLGVALMGWGRTQEAIEHLEQALRVRPDSAETHNSLGTALSQLGRMPDAVVHYEQALRIAPNTAEFHNNLGIALFRLGRMPDAVVQCERALQLKPDHAQAHYTLGVILTRMGRIQEAIGHYQEAVRLKPDLVEAQNALARLRAAQPGN